MAVLPVAPINNALPSFNTTAAPISLDAISTRFTGVVPALTQVLLEGIYFSACCVPLQRTVSTEPSVSNTQLSSDELVPLLGPATHVFVDGLKIAVRVSSKFPISIRPSASTQQA